MQRQGQVGEDGTPAPRRAEPAERRPRPGRPGQPGAPRRRATPRQFLHEVNVEMRKVAWPTRAETINYSTVVFITLAILMAFIFVLDLGFSKLSVFLFK
ncbi:MAG: preprotein translocase subunit SecE [Acidimicrobiales bacterium]